MDNSFHLDQLTALLEASAPPQTPAGVLAASTGLVARIAKLEPFQALATVAALQTETDLGCHTVRLDMATRLLLSHAKGRAPPTRDKLFRLLNRDLHDTGVHRLEDPPEDFFLTVVATGRGPFRVFQGVWEKAGAFTEDLLEAFGRLPRSPQGAAATDAAYGLLQISDALAFRAGCTGASTAPTDPGARLNLPNDRQLLRMSGRCVIAWSDLRRLGIGMDEVRPYLMTMAVAPDFIDLAPGESELERRPLIAFDEGILVVAPHNLTTAARAHLVETAVVNGQAERLRFALLAVQSERITVSSFGRLWDAQTLAVGGHPVRETMTVSSPGRPIHLLQVVDGFDPDGPATFGADDGAGKLNTVVEQSIRAASEAMRARPDFREGLTVVLLGGWGRGGGVTLPQGLGPAWTVIALEPEDAASIGVVGGRPMDLWRLSKQLLMVEEQGFVVEGANGWLNLFALWRHTGRTLIPEHEVDFQPPAVFSFPTDLLLSVRQDATRRHDRRSLPRADGGFDIVTRLDREDLFNVGKPSYCSTEAIRSGQMLGVVLGRRAVWLRVIPQLGSERAFDTHETWRTAIHWLEVGLPAFDAAHPELGRSPVEITLAVEWPDDRYEHAVDNDAIDAAIELDVDPATRTARVLLRPDWQHGLHRADNHAELRLAAVLLSVVSRLAGGDADLARLHGMVQDIVGSDDVRWRHSFRADRPLTLLKALGLLDEFRAVPESASALARCGSTLLSRPRSAGARINGAENCFQFLMAQHGALEERLLACIGRYDRTTIVERAASRLAAALGEEQAWTMSARALRAVYGPERDAERSLRRRSEINGVIRGGSILIEMAGSAARLADGMAVGQADVDELLAECLLLFQTAELVPPIRGGFISPKIEISPTGDLLYDHDFTRAALVPTVQTRHAELRAGADDAYRSHFQERGVQPIDPAFETAVAAEYGMPLDAFVTLSAACAEMCAEARTSLLRLRRSELLARLGAMPGYEAVDPRATIDRLTLRSRDGWHDHPAGTARADFDVSRFDRHHSLIARPIIGVSDDEDPLLVLSPPLIERAALHNLAGAMQGGLQGGFWISKEMRAFVGGVAERAGLEFNDRVAEAVRSVGMTAHASVKLTDALGHKGTGQVKRLGDVDVLAFSACAGHAWVIEAKDVRFCRTLAETTSRLSEYRGETDARGRRDNLRKHLDRVDYMRAHPADLARRYKLKRTPAVHGLIVFDSPQPMAFAPAHPSPDARSAMLADLPGFNWSA